MDRFVRRSRREPLDAAKITRPGAEPPRKRSRIEPGSESHDGDSPVRTGNDSGDEDEESLALPEPADQKRDLETEAAQESLLGVEDADTAQLARWVKGKSSIYVDAFNLALSTVLEDEAHLFDDKERAVFGQWTAMDYGAQYLYVRLFLRKTASWHRIERLGYRDDVPDMEGAIRVLLASHELPEQGTGTRDEGAQPLQDPLGDRFSFADDSGHFITSMDEAVSLLSLDEVKALAKEAKVQGKNKADLCRALYRMSAQQTGLSFGLRREGEAVDASDPRHLNRHAHFLSKILATTGPLIRLSEPVFRLFERVHLVFYRSTEWTEKSLITIILAKMSRRNFAHYVVCRSRNIFPSRQRLLEFEHSIRKEAEVDRILEFGGPPGEEGFRRVLGIFATVSARWRELLTQEQHDKNRDSGEGAGYLRRFSPAHAYTRIAHKAAHAHGRLHEHAEEHALLTELLAQRLFHPARRGSWYQRKALLEEHYMWETSCDTGDGEQPKKHWRRVAAATCQTALQDPDCHLIYHYDLQKRLVKLERRLRIPRRLQHDFGHVRLRRPQEHTVSGVQIKTRGDNNNSPGVKTVWLDEGEEPGSEVSVEEMCLSWYRRQGGWKGYHSEGGILRTLFAYLFFDVLFAYVPDVFQTAYQAGPLDLHTDAFYPARASEINHRLVEIANGGAEALVRAVDERERPRKTCVAGLSWDFDIEDLAELVRCFDGAALAAVCKVMAQEYTARGGGGVPDLVLWRGGESRREGETREGAPSPEVLFAEVKSANDRLSDTQRLWIHVLTGAGVPVALCNAVAREVKFR